MSDIAKYDVIVLGGGPGEDTAASRAADLGLSVCLVEERDRAGGVYLNVGCISSKTLPHAAAVIEESSESAEYGLEFTIPQIYNSLGSEFTIVEMLDHIIPPVDKDIVQPLFLKLKKKYSIYTRTKVTSLISTPEAIRAIFEKDGLSEQADFDAVLVAVGRRLNTADMGFDIKGLALNERGFLMVNNRQETNTPGFYGIGDVVAEPMFAHKSTHEGKVAAEVIAGHDVFFARSTIPSVAYTNPEVAWMGITEKEAKVKGLAFNKGKFPWGASGRALVREQPLELPKSCSKKRKAGSLELPSAGWGWMN